MFNPIEQTVSTRVAGTSETHKKRKSLQTFLRNKFTDNDGSNGQEWSGEERRQGDDRRQKNMIGQRRLDSRNKTDRRQAQFSIEV
ncbi:hypothetical protein [Thalassotalea euphylliae]|uniref:Uncharacterized protein n=1 Tax=Thalassotalea euphylliae TaxID=1655234 RepID=A0A3E0UDI3_9GAMM|nr:hypothetical protein [Thalassotalea euphylliae]REL35058.1 hypothetical protein DXX92_06590 [Thalassotalea euphylliae]